MTSTQSIITQAQAILQDTGVRWPVSELVQYLNDGQREAASLRPDQFTKSTSLTLNGFKHTLPAECSKFIEMPRNAAGQAIRQVDRNMLDAVEPSWYTKTGQTVVKHFCHDPRDPMVFWTYPPALGSTVDVTYAVLPADTTISGNLNVPDIFANAVLHFVLFRAFAKDAEYANNAALSAAHLQLFKAGLAEEAPSRQAVQPTPTN